MAQTAGTTVDRQEIEHFSRIADEWWDVQGKFRPLHKFNPVRIAYIKEKICTSFDRDMRDPQPLAGLRILDIGCGGGLLCEPLTRLGAQMVGVDAAATNIEVAKIHAQKMGLAIDYRASTAEDLAAKGEKFDVVLNMEVIEHVANVDLFVSACSAMVKPGGLMFVATINRTLKARALVIIGAEYILRWLPKGTHSYQKFIRPDELRQQLQKNGLTAIDETGISYHPLDGSWQRSRDMAANYIMLARRLA